MRALRHRFAQRNGLPFADVRPAERVERAFRDEDVSWREEVFTPVLTLWAFLAPVGCCRLAVARVTAWLVGQGQPACGPGTGGYRKARRRLPEGLLARPIRETGRALHDGAPEQWRRKGRRVRIADGTGVSMPDAPANQAEYPRPGSRADGLGFPRIRLVVLFRLACGAVLDAARGPGRGKPSGENALLRGLAGGVPAGAWCFGRPVLRRLVRCGPGGSAGWRW